MSLVTAEKSCFSDEITHGVWKLSMRINQVDNVDFGVIHSRQLEVCKTGPLRGRRETFVYCLSTSSLISDGNQFPVDFQIPKANEVVTLHLDMNERRLVLSVDGKNQQQSFSNIPNRARFVLQMVEGNRTAEILSFEKVAHVS
ncbi:hypothetical protein BLNAU_16458 [Blattamonas nauphoetae]|uniref:Galectin n=1 Tax=Blattamonas nauphoetae TaxID=2049346 RepID=A0ABQ9XCQ1_9EUKA|nr:hypothetical protein BLNAU_16458 [Blattamonas nauphoetae]